MQLNNDCWGHVCLHNNTYSIDISLVIISYGSYFSVHVTPLRIPPSSLRDSAGFGDSWWEIHLTWKTIQNAFSAYFTLQCTLIKLNIMRNVADHENHVRWVHLTTVLCMGECQKYARIACQFNKLWLIILLWLIIYYEVYQWFRMRNKLYPRPIAMSAVYWALWYR